MPRQYHNLDGVLRDLAAARRAGPEGEGDVYARWTQFVSEVEYALDEIEGPGSPDDAEDGDADASDELDGDDASGGEDDGVEPRRHDEGRLHRSAPASLLDGLLDRLAGPERAQAELELDSLRRDALAGTQPGAVRVNARGQEVRALRKAKVQ